jgi:hypothetical protein
MKIRNNRGQVIAEINCGVSNKGELITTHTRYDIHGNPLRQNLSIRRGDGTVETTTIIGRKILP